MSPFVSLLPLICLIFYPLDLASAKVFERAIVPLSFTKLDRAPSEHLVSLHIALRQPQAHKLEPLLYELSEPSSASYGHHLAQEDLQSMLQPSDDAVNAVTNWLVEHRLHSFEHNDLGFLTLDLPVSKLEELLGTQYHVYRHESGQHLVRTEEVNLPEHLHQFVDLVQPTTAFNLFRPQSATAVTSVAAKNAKALNPCPLGGCSASVMKSCDPDNITPACVRALYNINYTPKVPQKQFSGVTGYLSQYANYKDLQQFQGAYASSASLNFSVELVNGGKNSQTRSSAGVEAGLDTQLVTSLTYPIGSTFYSTGGSPPFTPNVNIKTNTNEPYLEYLQYLIKQKVLPSVISTSYGEDEETVPESYAKKVCSLYNQISLRGVSIIHSSGDGGAAGAILDGQCVSSKTKKARFLATFPASCPFVTSVGATVADPKEGFKTPLVAPYSSGGFSEIFPVPKYQSKYTKNYIAKAQLNNTHDGLFNANGRGFPDVALYGGLYVSIWQGMGTQLFGTSASAPVFASMITLLNDKRLAAGKPVLGFLNPWLYSTAAKAFTPVQSGSNPGCGPFSTCQGSCKVNGKISSGFPSTTYWSPTTGLGQPDFQKLLALA